MWKHFSHQADIGIKATAESLSGAFADAALGLTAIVTEPERVDCTDSVTIKTKAESTEMLFVNWLNAVIYEMATRNMLFGRFEVEIDDLRLSAKIWGERVDLKKHSPVIEPKAVTFNQLSVKDINGNWTVQCVIDV
jgi:SHS2 domain-containing protein